MAAHRECFSASYIYEHSTFAILGLPEAPGSAANSSANPSAADACAPLLAVVQNLIQRGTPTNPSRVLTDALGPIAPEVRTLPHYVDAAREPVWESTIKGARSGYNPALAFWRALLDALPEDMVHLRSLIEPEASLERILEEAGLPAEELAAQHVDFFCPLARLVIEIDGQQHEDASQKMLDARRDELLRLANVRTLRFTTRQLVHPEQAVADAIEALRYGMSMRMGCEVRPLVSGAPGLRTIQAFELAMRLQVTFVQLMRAGMLALDDRQWRISLEGDAPKNALSAIARAALDDVFAMLAPLAALASVPFEAPAVVFTDKDAQLVLDASAFRTWDERDLAKQPKGAPPRICIRSAHDPVRDEYRVACASAIIYDMEPSRHEAVEGALRFFLELLFGYERFKPGQLGIIRRALARKPTLGILPTGSGKSICYQLACLLQPAVSFVVCPIVSLIQDQERGLSAHGIQHASRLDSQMSTAERARVRKGLGQGRYQIIWVSPERFQDAVFRHELRQIAHELTFGYAVIDEVHCLSEWGHDFRVSYLLLKRTFDRFCPGACLLGLTATASRDVLADLKAELGITSDNIQTSSALSRPELHFHIKRTTASMRLRDLDAILDEIAARHSLDREAVEVFQPRGAATICGIIFANTRSGHAASISIGCEEIKDHVQARGIPAQTYHSGRGDDRAQIQRGFMDDEFPIMVATKSFGMGIDKPNVRFTIHANLPWSIEAFYQEAGRAGRAQTNNDADCYILYVPDGSEERTRRLFARSTSIEEIHALQPELEGDLATIFFLWNLGFAAFADELRRILLLLARLEEARTAHGVATIPADAVDDADVRPDHRGTQTEKALYKLAICGFAMDWTHDWNHGTLTVELAEADGSVLHRAERAVETYIARHSPGFSLSDPRPVHARYAEIYRSAREEERIASLIALLLVWTNDTIVFARRAAIGNMLALCEADLADDQIGAYINGYFKLDTQLASRIEKAAESPDDLIAWLDVFYEYAHVDDLAFERQLRSAEELADAAPLADRFRESYPDSLGVEWVSLMAKLVCGRYSQEDVSDQLAYVLDRAARGDGPDFDDLIDETDTLVRLCGADAQAAYEHAIVDWNPDLEG